MYLLQDFYHLQYLCSFLAAESFAAAGSAEESFVAGTYWLTKLQEWFLGDSERSCWLRVGWWLLGGVGRSTRGSIPLKASNF